MHRVWARLFTVCDLYRYLPNAWFVVPRVISDQPGGEARGADPGAGVSSEAAGQLAAETQHAAAQQRHAVPATARRPGHAQ